MEERRPVKYIALSRELFLKLRIYIYVIIAYSVIIILYLFAETNEQSPVASPNLHHVVGALA